MKLLNDHVSQSLPRRKESTPYRPLASFLPQKQAECPHEGEGLRCDSLRESKLMTVASVTLLRVTVVADLECFERCRLLQQLECCHAAEFSVEGFGDSYRLQA